MITCPHCGRENDCHDDIADPTNRPSNGDMSVCWGCREIGVFIVGPLGLAIRKPTTEELDKIGADPRVRRAVAALRESYTPHEAVGLLRGGGQ